MNEESVELRDFGPLKEKLEALRASDDESVRKNVGEVLRALREAEGNLEGIADTLENGVRLCLPKMQTEHARIVARLLERVPPEADSPQGMTASLLAFSRAFEELRGGRLDETPFPEEMSLDDIRREITQRDELCRHYGDLFATIMRAAGEPDAWTKNLEISGDSPLMTILKRGGVPRYPNGPKPLQGLVGPLPVPGGDTNEAVAKQPNIEGRVAVTAGRDLDMSEPLAWVNAKLSWHTPVDLDLHAFVRRRNGDALHVYCDNKSEGHDWITLDHDAGVGDTLDSPAGNEENIRCDASGLAQEADLVLFAANIYHEQGCFADYGGSVAITTSNPRQEIMLIEMNSRASGAWCVIAMLDNRNPQAPRMYPINRVMAEEPNVNDGGWLNVGR